MSELSWRPWYVGGGQELCSSVAEFSLQWPSRGAFYGSGPSLSLYFLQGLGVGLEGDG